MHDTNATKNTAAALPDVIRWFKNAGYRFDTVDQLEKKPEPPPSPRLLWTKYGRNMTKMQILTAKRLKIRRENCKKAQDIVY